MDLRRSFKFRVLNLLFRIFRTLVLPWKRTPANWKVVIFDRSDRFAVMINPAGRLPSGEVDPEQSVPAQCLAALGLHRSSFSDHAPFELIHIDGRGGGGVTFYFSGELASDDQAGGLSETGTTYLSRTMLGIFVPREVAEKLGHGSAGS